MANKSNDSRHRAAKLAALLAKHYPAASANAVADVVFDMQAATRAAHAFELRCNDDNAYAEAAQERATKRLQRWQDRINDKLAHRRLVDRACWDAFEVDAFLLTAPSPDAPPGTVLAARLSLGGDPRGNCGYLTIPGERGDGWGDGFAIY